MPTFKKYIHQEFENSKKCTEWFTRIPRDCIKIIVYFKWNIKYYIILKHSK